MKEPELHLSLLPASDGPHKSSSILPLTGILFKDNLALVHQYSLQCVPVTCRHGHYKTPMAQLSSHFPHTAQTVGGKPLFQSDSSRFAAETLFHSHAATICKFAITSLHGEMSLPRPNPDYSDLKGELLSIESVVWLCFVWFCLKPAITPNSTVQEVSDMVKAVV